MKLVVASLKALQNDEERHLQQLHVNMIGVCALTHISRHLVAAQQCDTIDAEVYQYKPITVPQDRFSSCRIPSVGIDPSLVLSSLLSNDWPHFTE